MSNPCASCATKDAVIEVLIKALSAKSASFSPHYAPPTISPNLPYVLPPTIAPNLPYVYPTVKPTPDTSRCGCQPANGGSGICGCILGGNQITN